MSVRVREMITDVHAAVTTHTRRRKVDFAVCTSQVYSALNMLEWCTI